MSQHEKDKGLVVKSTTALSAEVASMLVQDAGAGLDNVRPEDLTIPRLQVLQKTSPAVDDLSGSRVDGAKAGQFLDTSTQAVYDEAFVIPCEYKTSVVEWHPREAGGGFVAQHEPGYEDRFTRNDRGQWEDPEHGTILELTMDYYCLLVQANGDTSPVILSFKSSQLKKARAWLTRLLSKKVTTPDNKKLNAPIYESVWKLSTVPEKNEKGSWYGVKIDHSKSIDEVSLFKAAREARIMFSKNKNRLTPSVTEGPEA